MRLYPGLLLDASLRLERPLARGGMADIWLARDLTRGTKRAVKLVSPNVLELPGALDRFRREARLTAKAESDHVIHVFDVVTEGPRPYLVMEFLEGEDLAHRLARRGHLGIDTTMDVVDQVAQALEKAHSVGVVHRDVKPENIFLTDDGDTLFATLLDFGVGKDERETELDLTNPSMTVGSPRYMSPEQMMGSRRTDPRCDVWALAVVAYTCLTGRPPFDGDTYGAICVAIHAGTFDPPRKWRRDLPPAADAFFVKAFAAQIERRPQRPLALSVALRRALEPRRPSCGGARTLSLPARERPLAKAS